MSAQSPEIGGGDVNGPGCHRKSSNTETVYYKMKTCEYKLKMRDKYVQINHPGSTHEVCSSSSQYNRQTTYPKHAIGRTKTSKVVNSL